MRHRPKIVLDSHIPFLDKALLQVGDVTKLPPGQITADTVRHADALLVRTRTRCDASLLAGSSVRHVGTATIGYDHIDRLWCHNNGIATANAPGCNAPAVAQYVFACLAHLINRPLHQHTIGIVGVGNIGKIVESWARALDMRVLLCDPPRAHAEGNDNFVSLGQIAAEADIITFHTPLTREGDHATYHLGNAHFFASLRRAPILINASRGPVVDNRAWVQAIRQGQVSHSVVDVWEDEPTINTDLLALADIATPHIAGYSREGKIRASSMALDALCQTLNVNRPPLDVPEAPPAPASVPFNVIAASYNPMVDDVALRSNPAAFESLRDTYTLRHEPHSAPID